MVALKQTGKNERRITPDLARGFMLLLIGMAYAPMYLGHADVGGYGVRPGGGVLDQTASFLAALFLENRAFPMFAILFGYGMVMLVDRQRSGGASQKNVRRLLRRRALWLIVFGLVHAVLVFPGEILAAYGLGTLLIGWLVFRSDRAIRRAVMVLAVFSVVMALVGSVLMGAGAEEEAWGIPGYLTVQDWMIRLIGAPFAPLFNVLVYPLLVLVAIGLWLGRIGVLDAPERHARLLKRLAVIGITISVLGGLPIALAGIGVLTVDATAFSVLSAVQIVTGIMGGAGYVAVFGLIGMRLEGKRQGLVTQALVAAGQRSLTVYLMVSVGVAVLLHPDLLGLGAHVHRAGAMGIAFAVWAASVGVALMLERAGRRGPADALLRRLVYR